MTGGLPPEEKFGVRRRRARPEPSEGPAPSPPWWPRRLGLPFCLSQLPQRADSGLGLPLLAVCCKQQQCAAYLLKKKRCPYTLPHTNYPPSPISVRGGEQHYPAQLQGLCSAAVSVEDNCWSNDGNSELVSQSSSLAVISSKGWVLAVRGGHRGSDRRPRTADGQQGCGVPLAGAQHSHLPHSPVEGLRVGSL